MRYALRFLGDRRFSSPWGACRSVPLPRFHPRCARCACCGFLRHLKLLQGQPRARRDRLGRIRKGQGGFLIFLLSHCVAGLILRRSDLYHFRTYRPAEAFGSIPAAWWAWRRLTTVGIMATSTASPRADAFSRKVILLIGSALDRVSRGPGSRGVADCRATSRGEPRPDPQTRRGTGAKTANQPSTERITLKTKLCAKILALAALRSLRPAARRRTIPSRRIHMSASTAISAGANP